MIMTSRLMFEPDERKEEGIERGEGERRQMAWGRNGGAPSGDEVTSNHHLLIFHTLSTFHDARPRRLRAKICRRSRLISRARRGDTDSSCGRQPVPQCGRGRGRGTSALRILLDHPAADTHSLCSYTLQISLGLKRPSLSVCCLSTLSIRARADRPHPNNGRCASSLIISLLSCTLRQSRHPETSTKSQISVRFRS